MLCVSTHIQVGVYTDKDVHVRARMYAITCIIDTICVHGAKLPLTEVCLRSAQRRSRKSPLPRIFPDNAVIDFIYDH